MRYWREAVIPVSRGPARIMWVGTRGTSEESDMALDDIQILLRCNIGTLVYFLILIRSFPFSFFNILFFTYHKYKMVVTACVEHNCLSMRNSMGTKLIPVENMFIFHPEWDMHWLRNKQNQKSLAFTSTSLTFQFLLLVNINCCVLYDIGHLLSCVIISTWMMG